MKNKKRYPVDYFKNTLPVKYYMAYKNILIFLYNINNYIFYVFYIYKKYNLIKYFFHLGFWGLMNLFLII